jgi:hypothetical protein
VRRTAIRVDHVHLFRIKVCCLDIYNESKHLKEGIFKVFFHLCALREALLEVRNDGGRKSERHRKTRLECVPFSNITDLCDVGFN